MFSFCQTVFFFFFGGGYPAFLDPQPDHSKILITYSFWTCGIRGYAGDFVVSGPARRPLGICLTNCFRMFPLGFLKANPRSGNT